MTKWKCDGARQHQAPGALACGPRRVLGALRDSAPLLPQGLGLLVWALIADTPYHLYPAYGWVMFVAVFLWLVTIVLFVLYLFQLHMKWYMVPWPLVVSLGGRGRGCGCALPTMSGGRWGGCSPRALRWPAERGGRVGGLVASFPGHWAPSQEGHGPGFLRGRESRSGAGETRGHLES